MVNGPLVGPHPTGPAVHLTELLREILIARPDLHVTTRLNSVRRAGLNLASAAAIDPRVVARTTHLPERWVRSAQSRWGFPSERLLAGRYDIYHQFHTDAAPAVDADRLVVTLHDTVALTWPAEEGAMYAGAGPLLRRAAAVITVSEYSKAAICDAFDVRADQVHVIANGVRAERFRAPEAVPARIVEAPYLLYCGGHTPRKNVGRLVQAFAAVRREPGLGALRLVLAGPVIQRQHDLRASAPADLPDEALVFPGFVGDHEMVALYQHAEAFVFPSLYEGFGMPVLEAMAAGTPVVTSRASALPEVAGGAAVYVDAGEADSVAAGILTVLSEDSAAATVRRQSGMDRATQFTWQAAARRTLDLYDTLGAVWKA